jgi:hypothetical protein
LCFSRAAMTDERDISDVGGVIDLHKESSSEELGQTIR